MPEAPALSADPAAEGIARSESAVTPEAYRSEGEPVPGFRIRGATLAVHLSDDGRRARFRYACDVTPAGNFAADTWVHDIPADEPDIPHRRAWDDRYDLQCWFTDCDRPGARLVVRFPRLVEPGTRYRFWFEYDAPVHGVATAGPLKRTMVYSGWAIFLLPCDLLRVDIHLPARARLLHTAPPAGESDRAGPDPVRYRFTSLRPLEASYWLVAFQRRQLGIPFYVWTALQAAAGLMGWLIGRAMDAAVTS